MPAPRALLIGFGNPGRGDDGLGPALAEQLERLAVDGVDVQADYQLAPEHATAMTTCEVVVFVDACVSGPEEFSFKRLEPRDDLPFGSHSLQPAQVLALAEAVAGRPVEGYLLAIRGFTFEPFVESLSDGARRNLEKALSFIVPVLRNVVTERRAGRQSNLSGK